MIGNNSDKTWKYYGDKNPYYGVLTDPMFLNSNIENHKTEFFLSGVQYVDEVMKNIYKHIDPGFKPKVAVDFGCGVGRLTLPLSEVATEVYGMDISEGMLTEARNNCLDKKNISLILSDDNLTLLPHEYDLVHSYIVFQHIPVDRGMQIARILIERLKKGGIGVLHFTYAALPKNKDRKRKLLRFAYYWVPFLDKLRSIIKNEAGPMMQMNEYALNDIIRLIQETGCEHIFLALTNHNFYGTTFYFKK